MRTSSVSCYCASSLILPRDNAHGRIFPVEIPDNNALTVESCVNTCKGQNYTVAGMEYAGTYSLPSPPTDLIGFASAMLLREHAHQRSCDSRGG